MRTCQPANPAASTCMLCARVNIEKHLQLLLSLLPLANQHVAEQQTKGQRLAQHGCAGVISVSKLTSTSSTYCCACPNRPTSRLMDVARVSWSAMERPLSGSPDTSREAAGSSTQQAMPRQCGSVLLVDAKHSCAQRCMFSCTRVTGWCAQPYKRQCSVSCTLMLHPSPSRH
jgi:hypothetical protein